LKSASKRGISPAFDPDVTEYALSVAADVNTVNISATANDPKAISVQGAGAVSLNSGKNYISVAVTAEDGTVKIYTVTVTRESSGAPAFTCNVKSMLAKIAKPLQIPYTYTGPGQPEFISSNPAVCGVTQDGLLKPLKVGATVITIKVPSLQIHVVFAVTVSM